MNKEAKEIIEERIYSLIAELKCNYSRWGEVSENVIEETIIKLRKILKEVKK